MGKVASFLDPRAEGHSRALDTSYIRQQCVNQRAPTQGESPHPGVVMREFGEKKLSHWPSTYFHFSVDFSDFIKSEVLLVFVP